MEQTLSWIATAATIFAATITASNLGTRITGYGFVVFTFGSICWLAFGLASDQPALVWTNAALTFLNLFGVWRWLGRQARIEEGGTAASDDSRRSPGESLFPVSTLAKGEVLSAEGKPIGRCVDAMAGCSSGRIAYLVVAEGGVAGVGETLRRLPWTGCAVEDAKVRSPLGEAQFCALDKLEPDHWPAR